MEDSDGDCRLLCCLFLQLRSMDYAGVYSGSANKRPGSFFSQNRVFGCAADSGKCFDYLYHAGDGKRIAGYIYDGVPSGAFEYPLSSSYELERRLVWNDLDTVDH